jgi:hypothetical protein
MFPLGIDVDSRRWARYRGEPTTNRLLVEAEFMDASNGKAQLQLDTGAKMPEIFPTGHGSV